MRTMSPLLLCLVTLVVAAVALDAGAGVKVRVGSVVAPRPITGAASFTVDVFVDVTESSSLNLATFNVPVDLVEEGQGVTLLADAAHVSTMAPFTGAPIVAGAIAGVDMAVADNTPDGSDFELLAPASLKLFTMTLAVEAGAPDGVLHLNVLDHPFLELGDSLGSAIAPDALVGGTIFVPEPATALVLLGLGGVILRRP